MVHHLQCPLKQKLGLVFSFQGDFSLRRHLGSHPAISYQRTSDTETMSVFFGMSPPTQAAFPTTDFDMALTFMCLSIPHVIQVMECFLGECKVLFLSSKARLLANVSQTFLTLMWPFNWV
jgi:hypothetical protein